jgi:PEP-CTERM motif
LQRQVSFFLLFWGFIMRKLVLAAAALALGSPLAASAAPTINVNFTPSPSISTIVASNNFKSKLNAAGFTNYTTPITSLILSGMANVQWSYMGSESGFSDAFNSVHIGTLSFTETSTGFDDKWNTPVIIGTQTYASGTNLTSLLSFTSNFGLTAGVGSAGFAAFLKPGAGSVSGAGYTTIYFGYDDERVRPDRDYDDFVVRAIITAVPVPEPGTWVMILSGFAIVGSLLRRRRSNGVTVLA